MEDAEAAGGQDLEGVGLFRTEFVFLGLPRADRRGAGEDHPQAFRPFGDRRVVVRTLDAGADKPLAFADLDPRRTPPSAGAGSGWLLAERPELFIDPLRGTGDRRDRRTGLICVMAVYVAMV